MAPPMSQTSVVQSKTSLRGLRLPLKVADSRPVPDLPSPYHVLVRVLAVSLNPADYKMVTHFYMDGNTVGCDFCGIVEAVGSSSLVPLGVTICGGDFPYRPNNPFNGAFAQYVAADSRHVLRTPTAWSDTQAAALGGTSWNTSCLAIADPEAMNLKGLPSKPAEKAIPVLVYGGATATGIMAIQMLQLSGYLPIAVCSSKSAPLVMKHGAIGTASYTSATCVDTIRSIAQGVPIKHALDCITDAESAAVCFSVLSRVGGRYVCLEDCPESWRKRRSVKVKVVMVYESMGYDVDLGHPTYARKANLELHAIASLWTEEMQSLLNNGLITTQRIREIDGQFEGIIEAMEMLQSGEVKGEKLVVRVSR